VTGSRWHLLTRRFGRPLVYCLISIVFLSGCSTTPVVRIDQGTPQQELLDLETRILDDSRQLELKLQREGAIYEDSNLSAYLRALWQRLVPNDQVHSPIQYDFKIVRDPTVNAYAIPSGRTYYHAGLISKMRNPDMLAGVMAHEISHVVHRDTLYLLDDLKQKTIAAKIAEMALVPAAAVFGAAGLASMTLNVVYATSVTGYGRDKEAQADGYALERLRAAGMNPAATSQVFEVFLKERERYQRGLEIWFVMNHPTNEQRLEDAREWLKEQGLEGLKPPPDDLDFLRLTEPVRLITAEIDIRFERYFHALDTLEDVLSREKDNSEALTLQGTCYRKLALDQMAAELELSRRAWNREKRSKADWESHWQAKAKDVLLRAVESEASWAPAYRELGLLYMDQKEKEQAIEHLEAYLELAPEARDKRFVRAMLRRLREDDSNGK